jgi:phage terminase large subunit
MLVEEHYRNPGTRSICIREVQKTLAESSKQIVESKISTLGLGSHFRVTREHIETPGGGVILFQGMQNHTAESIKSLEGCRIAWVDEAQTLSERSLSLLRPTIRVDNSEIWFSWNPRRKTDAVDKFLRELKPESSIVVECNWRDNPWWNATLEAERLLEFKLYPERYQHIYEGAYATAFEGAYFAKLLSEAKSDGRITKVAIDPLLPIYAFADIGGSGASADAFVFWIVQFVGQAVNVLNYHESIGQVLAFHVAWLRTSGYERAIIRLPHDGVNENNVTGKQYADHFRDAGFDVPPPVPNQGRGAAAMRIEAVRRIFSKCWFNEATTEAGRDALGYYHEKKDDQRNIGLGPEHDWSSHAADGFGLMAVCYEEPSRTRAFNRPIAYPSHGVA